MDSPVPLNALFAVLPESILGIVASLLFVLAPFTPKSRRDLMGYFALIGLTLSGASLFLLCGKEITAFNGMIVVDPFALLFKSILLLTAGLTILMSIRYINIVKIHLAE